MRRALLIGLVLPVALAGAGCGGTPTPAQQRRADFIKRYKDLDDQQLAVLCPSLYPSDFLSSKGPGKYHYSKHARRFVPTTSQKAAAKAAGCTDQGTKPK